VNFCAFLIIDKQKADTYEAINSQVSLCNVIHAFGQPRSVNSKLMLLFKDNSPGKRGGRNGNGSARIAIREVSAGQTYRNRSKSVCQPRL